MNKLNMVDVMDKFRNIDKRKIIIIVFMALAVIAFVVSVGSYASSRSKLSSLSVGYAKLAEVRDEFVEINSRVSVLQRKRNSSSAKTIMAAMDKVVSPLGIKEKMQSLNSIASPPTAPEDKADAIFEHLTLNEVINLFYSIKTSPSLIKVRSMQLKTSFADPELFDLTLKVSLVRPQ